MQTAVDAWFTSPKAAKLVARLKEHLKQPSPGKYDEFFKIAKTLSEAFPSGGVALEQISSMALYCGLYKVVHKNSHPLHIRYTRSP
jgi:hypothetical protein